jgi:hypothetical protein
MHPDSSYFVYCPPKSNSHGHSVKDKNLKRATQKVIDSFMSSFNAVPDNKLQLTLHYDKINELQKAQKTIELLSNFLGPNNRESDNYCGLNIENTISWENIKTPILDIINFIESNKDETLLPISNYDISSFFHYGEIPEKSGFIMLSIGSGKLFVRLSLTIPFPIDNEKSYEVLSKFGESLPFKLNDKHFRRLGPSKKGYGQWKLDEETQQRVKDCLTSRK